MHAVKATYHRATESVVAVILNRSEHWKAILQGIRVRGLEFGARSLGGGFGRLLALCRQLRAIWSKHRAKVRGVTQRGKAATKFQADGTPWVW
jgi:hypothetical protein